ncbi:DUF4230 domain-containing protein [Treponema brennaborense]|uniref:DUF4230 domain-containing protein n=1 Tax=Treponema brennaborense (strain DSM 12168 / CIP 105900 / DD5/3) TaxID=906968 RepID=F4LL36_TREBD|nr:DUF4230 domain-containing protein [Treponema brennaborense]AEE17610.1 hypothetical protein Trebr_2198 [Treponema brennaborense DSM 12168]
MKMNKKKNGGSPKFSPSGSGRSGLPFRIVLPFVIVFGCTVLIALLVPRKSVVQSIVTALVPLVCLIFVYVSLRRAAARAGKTLAEGFTERTETSEASALVLRKLLACSKLTVLSSIYTDVVLLKKSRLWGLSKTYGIYRYIGELEAGIPDMQNARFTVDADAHRVYVDVLPPEILHHSVKKIEKFDEHSSLFCKINNSEVFDEIDARKKASEALLVEHGFLTEAADRAETVVTQLLAALGYGGFDVVFRTVKKLRPDIAEPLPERSVLYETPAAAGSAPCPDECPRSNGHLRSAE